MSTNWRQLLSEANRLLAIGQLARAEPLYRTVLSARPRECDALHGLGTICAHTHRAAEALTLLQLATELKPSFAEAHATMAFALLRLKKPAEAMAAFQAALALRPNDAALHCNYGSLLFSEGKFEPALAAFQRSIDLFPGNAEAHFNLANTARVLGHKEMAVAGYRRAIEIRPAYGEALHALGFLLRRLSRFEEALAEFRRAIALSPPFTQSIGGIAGVLHELGRTDEAIPLFQEHLRLHLADADTHSAMLHSMECVPDLDPSAFRAAYRAWGETHGSVAVAAHPNEPVPDRRLRVGYCSPDFRTHSVSYFLEPLLANHNPAAVELFCYADVSPPDATTVRLQSLVPHWRQTTSLSDVRMAELIREDRIDILVDLAGHSAANRLRMFAHKPAPVQVTYLGFPATTGLTAIDYRLTDAFADPPGPSDEDAVEKLIRLPNTFLCYLPPGEAPAPRVHRDRTTPVTFCSFNVLSKTNAAVLSLWARILQQVPNSRMLIKTIALAAPTAREWILDAFRRLGVPPERIELLPYTSSMTAHLDLYNQADIALDTFPYNGTTTTCEALWMGVPVVTLAGNRHAGRVGVSILSNLGLPDLVAESADQYIEKAVQLATDPSGLADLRNTLRDRMKQSPLMNYPAFAAAVENAYRQVWKLWCATATSPQD